MSAAVHTHEEFEFLVGAPIDVAWPLFGADREREWAPGWQPEFVWPATAADQPGMVFKIAHGDTTAVWVNTSLDRTANRAQYVYFIPDVVVTVITLELTELGSSTRVGVSYERTALTENAGELVRQMAARDQVAGPEWCGQINRLLARRYESASPILRNPTPLNQSTLALSSTHSENSAVSGSEGLVPTLNK
jgi:hypothetical protein